MKYNFRSIEKKWQKYWADNNTYKTKIDLNKQKYYVMDMFPYPSGEGLHVGHPLGYIASDIYSRFKKLKGYNVLHPQGYDSFGLPAEQYAIQTGQHPKKTTEENVVRNSLLIDEGDALNMILLNKSLNQIKNCVYSNTPNLFLLYQLFLLKDYSTNL